MANSKKEEKVWVVMVDYQIQPVCYTGLKAACESAGVSYRSALGSSTCIFIKKGIVIKLAECSIERVSGRGRF